MPAGTKAKEVLTACKPEPYKWEFKASFRRGAFGWRSQPAITRIKQAVNEIKKVACKQPVVAAEGAVIFIERVSAALERVDGSSGSMGAAVNNAIEDLAPVIANAESDAPTREKWLERLWKAHEKDDIPYIEVLTEYWGMLCASKQLSSSWADRLIDRVKFAWRPDRKPGEYFKGTDACLSCLYTAERYEELLELLKLEPHGWIDYHKWGVKALAATNRVSEAISYAEKCRKQSTNGSPLARVCEDSLLGAGQVEEAYKNYAMAANQCTTNVATFRAIQKKYPSKQPNDILADLIATTPGEEGKWFATAKEAGFFDLALQLVRKSPCDPKTLTRAARDYADSNPSFALGAGLAAMRWLIAGYGYEIAGSDILAAYSSTMKAAENLKQTKEARDLIRNAVSSCKSSNFVARSLESYLGRG